IKINNNNFTKILKEKGWGGEGTTNNPVIIKNIDDLKVNFILKELEIFIIINECSVNSISLISCMNIIINRCQFASLNLLRSFNNMFKNNVIKRFKIKFSGNNSFINNQLSKRAFNYLNKTFWTRDLLQRFLTFFLVVLTIIIPLGLHSLVFNARINLLLTFIAVIFILCSVFLLHYMFLVRWEIKRIPPDVLSNNKKILFCINQDDRQKKKLKN
ncbi:MAG: hypothetical protein ACTSUT_10315, partial [Promethearchaeota archaeon]